MRKLIIIGNCYEKQNNGAANVIRNLIKEFDKKNITYDAILVSEKCSKKAVFYKIIKTIPFSKGNVINVHTDGLILPFVVYCLTFINRKNDYYITVHGSYFIESRFGRKPKKVYLYLEKVIYKYFPNMICVSEMQKEDLVQLYKREKPTYVIPNGTDALEYLTEEKIPNDEPQLIMLGGIRSEKGIWNTLDFIHYLHEKKRIDARLSVYGSVESEELRKNFCLQVYNYGLKKHVKYEGIIIDKKKIYSVIENADFQLCLSNYDSFNVAILESLACGCPCICTNKCGAASFVEESGCGIVIDGEDIEWFEQAANYLENRIKNPDTYMDDCNRGKAAINNATWKAISEMYISFLKM